MADTVFVDGDQSLANRIVAAWLNVVNKVAYWGRKPNYATTTGAANAQILTLAAGSLYSPGTEATGDSFSFTAGFSNSAAMTLQVIPPAGLNTARAVQLRGVALTGGEIIAGQSYTVTRVGTVWEIGSPTENTYIKTLLADTSGTEVLDTIAGTLGAETDLALDDFTVIFDSSGGAWKLAFLRNLIKLQLQLSVGMGYTIQNGYLDWGSSGNELALFLTTLSGGTPSATDPVYIAFRSSTALAGAPVIRRVEQSTGIIIENTATLGTINGTPFRIWCVAFDDGGTVRLALIYCLLTATTNPNIFPLAGWGIASATQESSGSDSAHVFYSDGAAISGKAYTVLGYATWETGLATAGVWNANPTREHLQKVGDPLPGQCIQLQGNMTGAVATGTTAIPADDSIPQSGEGDEYMSQAITPTSAANVIVVSTQAMIANATGDNPTIALFQDAVANALCATGGITGVSLRSTLQLEQKRLASTTSAITFKLRAGYSGGTTTFNGVAGGRLYGGVAGSYISVTELQG
jgi:hypothetical protein